MAKVSLQSQNGTPLYTTEAEGAPEYIDHAGGQFKRVDAATYRLIVRFKIVQAMPGTDGYGHYVLVSNDGRHWSNFFGKRPMNEARLAKVKANCLENGYVEVPADWQREA